MNHSNPCLRIGFCGSHRTGKTFLAERLSERYGLVFARTQSSAVFDRLGLDVKADYPLDQRLAIQNAMLDDAANLFRAQPGGYVTDRTFLDFLIYLWADITRANATGDLERQCAEFKARCCTLTNMLFDAIVIVQPAIRIPDADGKASVNEAYMDHLNLLALGLSRDDQIRMPVHVLPLAVTDIGERLDWVAHETGIGRTSG